MKTLWDDEVRSITDRRAFLALGALLLLLVIGGAFFLLPIGGTGMPVLAASRRQPTIVASKNYVQTGEVLALSGDQNGFWRVQSHEGSQTINRFDLAGETEWARSLSTGQPLVDVNGQSLILADQQTGQIFTFSAAAGIRNSMFIHGSPQQIATSSSGEFLVIHIPEGSSTTLQPMLDFYSSQGTLLFSTNFENAVPLYAKINQFGNQLFIVLMSINPQGVTHHLVSYAATGQLLWTAELPEGPPTGFSIKPNGDRVAVSIGKTLQVYSGLGQLLWQHSAQNTIDGLDFIGPTDRLAYSSVKLSVLSFQRHSQLTVLSESGSVHWQYRLNGLIPDFTAGHSASVLAVGSKSGLHYLDREGQVRWSFAQGSELEDMRIAISADGGSVLLQLANGRMFVLRGE